jgi:hypothetical protein
MKTVLRIGDKKIAIEHPAGSTLTLEGGKLEVASPSHRSLESQLNDAMGKEGIKWGDAIAWATTKLGLEACAACKARQRILNQAKSLGIAETIRQIKGTFNGVK